MPEVYDWHLQNSPNHPLYSYIELDGSTRTITWAEAVRAIQRTAQMMRTEMGFLPDGVPQLKAVKPVVGILTALGDFIFILSICRNSHVLHVLILTYSN